MNKRFDLSQPVYAFAASLAAMIFLFWWSVWTPFSADRMHFAGDILIKDYATRMGMFNTLLSGALPLWDPYQFGGWPGLANCEAGFFYPFHWLMLPFVGSAEGSYLVAQLTVLLHIWIAGLGVFALCRFAGLSGWGAALAGVAFAFCGFHCAHKQHTNMLFALAWFPWLLLIAERWAREPRWSDIWKFAAILALAFLAGHPQAALYMTLLLGARMAYGVWERCPASERRALELAKRAAPIAAAVTLAFGIAAAQWLPTLEMIRQGERAEAGQYQRSTEFSLPPHELIDAVLPEALQHWSQVEVFYWGIVPLLLALIAVLRGGFSSLEKYLLASALIAVALSLGRHIFLFDISYVLIPGAAWVRAPSRWIYFAGLPLAFFAGRALDWIMQRPERLGDPAETRLFYRVLAGAGVLLAGLTIVAVVMTSLEAAGAAGSPERAYLLEAPRRVLVSLVWLGLFGGSFFLLLRLVQMKRIAPAVFAALAIALIWLDLGTRYRWLDLQPGPGGYPDDPAVEAVKSYTWNHRTKVFLGGGGIRERYHGAAQGFYELDGNSPLTPMINLDLRQDTALVDPLKPNRALFDLFGVGAILTDARPLPVDFVWRLPLLYTFKTDPLRARIADDRFAMDAELQRDALKLQSFPFNRVAMTEDDDREPGELRLFPKPFLFASASAAAFDDAALLIVDGNNVFENLEPEGNTKAGYYLASANPVTGEIERKGYFNLMYSVTVQGYPEHQRLLNFIDSIPEGHVVFAAARDNAADSLLPMGLGAFRRIGASFDVRTRFRLAHAVMGVKGAPVGSAVEVASATEALVMQTSQSVYMKGKAVAPPLAPQVEWVETGTYAKDWFRLHQSIYGDETSGLTYAGPISAVTDAPAPVAPMMVYSSINPWESLEGGVQVGKAGLLIGGQDVSLNLRGYNLALYDPEANEVIDVAAFDLGEDYDPDNPQNSFIKDPPIENRRMQRFIEGAPDGHYILGALRGEGTDLLLRETVDVLRSQGSSFVYHDDPERRKFLSHAFVLVKGASRCVEMFNWKGPDSVVFTRYPGGPALTPPDFEIRREEYIPADPVEEIMRTVETAPFDQIEEPLPWLVESESPNHIRASGSSEQGGTLVLGEVHYPGWSAYVNGKPAPIERVNYFFRGVRVEPGVHQVELVYEPGSFYLGAAISVTSLAVWIAGVFLLRRNKKPAA